MQLPLFEPKSEWTPPASYPDVPAGATIAVDTETRDNGLAHERGPGWATRDGHIAGFSVAVGETAVYVPLRHPDSANHDGDAALRWLQHAFDQAGTVVAHNSGYDAGWLGTEGLCLPFDKFEDTQFQAGMIDENQLTYNLDACCRRAGVHGKDETKLREAAAAFGVDPKKDMWKLPAKYVGPYAEQDARATLQLFQKQKTEIEKQDLQDAYRLEMDLMPMTLEMRRRGIRINEGRADDVQRSLRIRRDQVLKKLSEDLGQRRRLTMEEMNSPDALMRLFDQEGVSYPRTPKTKKGSFKSDWMKDSDHWLPQSVVKARQLHDLSEKFIGNYILGSMHLGRVHAEIHQLRDDDGGTRSYRLSYSNPPVQQIPARTDDGRAIRTLFEAEAGQLWGAADYSQQEPRLAVHFAAVCKVAGADEAVRYYCDDPGADFHTMVAELTGLTRKQAKIINLGLMYGMGLKKLAYSLGVSLEEAQAIITQYHARMPFVQKLNEFCEGRAGQRGFIRLLDGARCRFDTWEPRWRGDGAASNTALPYERAVAAYGGARKIRRAHVRKAMNRLVQGSAARQTKLAMRECWRNGIVPLLQMHDELDFGFDDPRQGELASEIMTNIVKLRIPMKVDLQYGHNWGQASEEMKKGIEPPTFEELMHYGSGLSNMEIVQRRAA